MNQLVILLFVLGSLLCMSCTFLSKRNEPNLNDHEELYLQRIRLDFINHEEDLATILSISKRIVSRIDSLLNGQIKISGDSELVHGIMNTRAYDRSILAYKDILNGDYIQDPDLKLKIASHCARFEGIAESKRTWDYQWDVTARPYVYDHGLLSTESKGKNLITDPVFRSLLLDRRMFAYDVEKVTPGIAVSVNSVINTIDALLKK